MFFDSLSPEDARFFINAALVLLVNTIGFAALGRRLKRVELMIRTKDERLEARLAESITLHRDQCAVLNDRLSSLECGGAR